MTGSIAWLAVAVAFFVGIHLLISGTPVRGAIVALTGERAFGAVFAVAAAFGLGWIGWRTTMPRWWTCGTPNGFRGYRRWSCRSHGFWRCPAARRQT